MNFKKSTLAGLMGLMFVPGSVFAAEGLSYTYIEGNYIIQDVDLVEDDSTFDDFVEDTDDGGGLGIHGSVAITDYLFLFGKYSSTEADFTFTDDTDTTYPQDQDVKILNLGLGWHTPIGERTDVVVRGAYMDLDYGEFSLGQDENDGIDTSNELEDAVRDLNDDTSDGYLMDVGLRMQSTYWLEVGGGVRYTDLDMGENVSVFGSLLFEITQNMGIKLEADVGDTLATYDVGFRYSF